MDKIPATTLIFLTQIIKFPDFLDIQNFPDQFAKFPNFSLTWKKNQISLTFPDQWSHCALSSIIF